MVANRKQLREIKYFLVPRRGIEPGPPQCERLTTCKKTIFAFIKAWYSPNTPKNFLIG